MMKSAKLYLRYFEDAAAQYVMLPYTGDSGFAALIALPRTYTARPLKAVNVEAAMAALKLPGSREKGFIELPRFDIESSDEMRKKFEAIGISRMFEQSAEFPGITEVPLSIGLILHKVVMKVDESGTKAAAATAVAAVFGCAAPSKIFEMRCDRPFAFCVVHQESSAVLFAGDVVDPGEVGEAPGANSASFLGQLPRQNPPSKWSPLAPTAAGVSTLGLGAMPPGPAFTSSPAAISDLTMAQRQEQSCLFTPSVRRDVYRVLCSVPRLPLMDGQGDIAPQALLALPALKWIARASDAAGTQVVLENRRAGVNDDDAALLFTLQIIEQIGQSTERGIAFTGTFERLLAAEYVPFWRDADVAAFSVAFLVAFGMELTPRLDISHAMRSRKMTEEEVIWLRELPAAVGIDKRLLDVFQGHM